MPSRLRIFFFFQAEDGIRDYKVTGVQTCALPISDAERSYLRALTVDPGLRQAEVNLESLEAQNGRPRPRLLQSLSALRELEGRVVKRDYSEATLALAQRLDKDLPDSPKVRFFYGSLLMARGRPADAVAPLEW